MSLTERLDESLDIQEKCVVDVTDTCLQGMACAFMLAWLILLIAPLHFGN